jgi:predicted RNase H-like nuclease (RuvC/YqgF family)
MKKKYLVTATFMNDKTMVFPGEVVELEESYAQTIPHLVQPTDGSVYTMIEDKHDIEVFELIEVNKQLKEDLDLKQQRVEFLESELETSKKYAELKCQELSDQNKEIASLTAKIADLELLLEQKTEPVEKSGEDNPVNVDAPAEKKNSKK